MGPGSDRVEGTAVRRSNGEKVGTIERLMIEKVSGKVAYKDEFYLGVTDESGRYRSWPVKGIKFAIDAPARHASATPSPVAESGLVV